jgi:nitroreductase
MSTVENLMDKRYSCRAFLRDEPVDESLLRELIARWVAVYLFEQ